MWRVGESNPRLFIMSEYRYVKLLYNFLSKIVFLLLHATVAPTRNFYTHILFNWYGLYVYHYRYKQFYQISDPYEARTRDPHIKSVVLYQLS